MDKITRSVWWIVVIIFGLFSILTVAGFIDVWFINPGTKLPYLNQLFIGLVMEAVGLVFMLVRNSMKFMPQVKRYKNEQEVNKFLRDFALRGSSVEIASNRAAWLGADTELLNALITKAARGSNVTILTARKPDWLDSIRDSKVQLVYDIPADYVPNARFTLLNSGRQGAEELAIAVGSFPGHDVFIFNYKTSPQIIGLAKDIVKLLKIAGGDSESE